MTTIERPRYNAVGEREPRVEGLHKVTGRTVYAADVQLPGMLHARLVLSPHPHARITALDAEAALAHPGVVAVVTADDLARASRDGSNPARGASNRADALFADREAVFAGQPVAAVLGESYADAEEGAELVRVEYEVLPAVLDVEAAMEPDSPLARSPVSDIDHTEEDAHVTIDVRSEEAEGRATNIASHLSFERGDLDEGFSRADFVVEQSYRAALVHQGYIEPHATVASYDAATGDVAVWTSTQGQFHVRDTLMRLFKLPETKLRVVGCELGGGFGGKMIQSATIATACALVAGRPVKLVFTRREDLLAATPTPGSVVRLRSGITAEGDLTALEATVIYDAGAFPGAPVAAGTLLISSFYRWPHLRTDGYEVLTNHVSVGAIRAPGIHNITHAIEQQIDAMALGVGLDPADVRLRNAVRTGDEMASGKPFPAIGMVETIEAAAGHPIWTGREAARARSTETTRVGVGLAVSGWLGGLQPATCELMLNSDGTVNAVVGVMDISGVNTSFAQIVAEELAIPVERVSVSTGDTRTAPYAGIAAGSKTTITMGRAVREAAVDLREQMFSVAADQLEANPTDMVLGEGEVQVAGSPDRSLTFRRLAAITTGFGSLYTPIVGKGAISARVQAPGFTAQLAELEVDTVSGNVTLTGWATVQDAGYAINPLSVEGQMEGGTGMGIGIGLSEEYLYDDEGRLRNAGLLDYRMPTAADTPDIESVIVEVPSEEGPYGARGVGEPSITAGGAAIANALHDALGVRLTEMPATPERVLRALGRVAD